MGLEAKAAPRRRAPSSFFFLPASAVSKKSELATRQANKMAKAEENFILNYLGCFGLGTAVAMH